jgi:hypothetical protein
MGTRLRHILNSVACLYFGELGSTKHLDETGATGTVLLSVCSRILSVLRLSPCFRKSS